MLICTPCRQCLVSYTQNMSSATLVPTSAFGVRSDVADNVCFLDEQHVVYPAGGNIVILNTDQKTQRFLPASEGAGKFTSMVVSPNRRYIAIAEKADKPSVTVYDLQTLKKRKVCASSLMPLLCLHILSLFVQMRPHHFLSLRSHSYRVCSICRHCSLVRMTHRRKNLLPWPLRRTLSTLSPWAAPPSACCISGCGKSHEAQ